MTPPLAPGAADAPFLLLAALVLDALSPPLLEFGRVLPGPAGLTSRVGLWLARRLDRARRSDRTRLVRGALVTLVVAGLAGSLGWLLERLSMRYPLGFLLELLVAVTALGQRRCFAEARRVARALAAGPGGLARARIAVAPLLDSPGDVDQLDGYGVARAGIEAVAVGFGERVVAPVFWFLLLGLPGMLVAVAVNGVVPRERGEGRFALTAEGLDMAIQFLPARLAGLLLVLAACFAPTARPLAAFRLMRTGAAAYGSAHRGRLIAAMAGALDLALAGSRRSTEGKSVPQSWIGSGRARAEWADVHRSLYLFAVACLLVAALVAVLALLDRALA